MPPVAEAAPAKTTKTPHRCTHFIAAAVFVLVMASLAIFLHSRLWPFTSQSVLENLHEATDSEVTVRAFHRTYFPSPGCVLEGVSFVHDANARKPLMTIEKLTIRGSYSSLFLHHIDLMQAEGLRIYIGPFGTNKPFHTQHSEITVGGMVANGATVEFGLHDSAQPPLRFDIPEVSLQDVAWKGPFSYAVRVHNPLPPGEVVARGKFGGWNESDPAQTPISGEYKLENADLGVYGGIAGTLSSTGKFSGSLGHIDISGTTHTPDFEVTSGAHPVLLETEFNAYEDATRGDTFLKRVDARFRKTRVIAEGSVAKSDGSAGKAGKIQLSVRNGRIEDILGLFVSGNRPPMSGDVTMRVEAEIPSGDQPFLRKVKLRGNFGIGGGEFSAPSTRGAVNKFSAGARGEKDTSDPETVLTDLSGQVALQDGVAQFAGLSFGIPGARARMHGTYNIIDYKIDLHGEMRVQTKISNTNSGVKALLLKMLDPVFKKRKKGEILPVRISGTYEKPSFGLDLMDKKAKAVLPSATRLR